MIKMIKPLEFPVYNPPSPKELECLGMKLADMNLLFRKGFMELNFDYKRVDVPSDPEGCDKFVKMMRKGPESMIEEAKETIGSNSVTDYLQKKRDELDSTMD